MHTFTKGQLVRLKTDCSWGSGYKAGDTLTFIRYGTAGNDKSDSDATLKVKSGWKDSITGEENCYCFPLEYLEPAELRAEDLKAGDWVEVSREFHHPSGTPMTVGRRFKVVCWDSSKVLNDPVSIYNYLI